jgi:pilus assembly protein Flp/PilA
MTLCFTCERLCDFGTGVDKGAVMSKLSAYLNGEIGASAAEYALILAIVGAALAAACLFLSSAIANALDSAGSCIQSAGGNC